MKLNSHAQKELWMRFYPDDKQYNYSKSVFNERTGNYFVNYGIFSDLKKSAIFIEAVSQSKLLASNSFFSDIKSEMNGGALNIESCDCVQYRLCCINITVSQYQPQSVVYSTLGSEQKNYIIDSSISQMNSQADSFRIVNGKQLISRINLTHSYARGFGIYRISNDNKFISKQSFNTYANNNSTFVSITYFDSNYYSIDSCQFVSNKAPNIALIGIDTLASDCYITIQNSLVIDNDYEYFGQFTNGHLNNVNNYFSGNPSTIEGNEVTINQTFVNVSYFHFSSYLCEAQLSLTAIYHYEISCAIPASSSTHIYLLFIAVIILL